MERAVDCPAAVRRLADFRLRYTFHIRPPTGGAVTVLDTLIGELRATAGGIANHEPVARRVGEVSVVREGEPRQWFMASDGPVGELLVNRQTVIAAELIVTVAAPFRPIAPTALAAAEMEAGAA